MKPRVTSATWCATRALIGYLQRRGRVVRHVWQVVLGSPANTRRTVAGQRTNAGDFVVNPS